MYSYRQSFREHVYEVCQFSEASGNIDEVLKFNLITIIPRPFIYGKIIPLQALLLSLVSVRGCYSGMLEKQVKSDEVRSGRFYIYKKINWELVFSAVHQHKKEAVTGFRQCSTMATWFFTIGTPRKKNVLDFFSYVEPPLAAKLLLLQFRINFHADISLIYDPNYQSTVKIQYTRRKQYSNRLSKPRINFLYQNSSRLSCSLRERLIRFTKDLPTAVPSRRKSIQSLLH